jgi:hypothetical protein
MSDTCAPCIKAFSICTGKSPLVLDHAPACIDAHSLTCTTYGSQFLKNLEFQKKKEKKEKSESTITFLNSRSTFGKDKRAAKKADAKKNV